MQIIVFYVYTLLLCMCLAEEEFEAENIIQKWYNADLNGTIIFQSEIGSITYRDDVAILDCYGRYSSNESFEPTKTIIFKHLDINNCIISTTPFKELLLKFNINSDELETLILHNINKALEPGNYTVGLNIKHLIIMQRDYEGILLNNPNFLTPLTNLTFLKVDGIYFPPIPPRLRLESLHIRKCYFEKLIWDSCENLKDLHLESIYNVEIPKAWKEKCKQLKKLTLDGLVDYSFVKDIYTAGLKIVEIIYGELRELPKDVLSSARDTLTHLNLRGNRLKDDSLLDFMDLPNVTDLDLSQNKLDGTTFHEWTKHFKKLRNLKLNGNLFNWNFCLVISKYSKEISKRLSLLESLSLNEMPNVNLDCLASVHLAKLEFLGLAASIKNTYLQLDKIVKTNATHLTVDLERRHIKEIKQYYYDDKTVSDSVYEEFLETIFSNIENFNVTLKGAKIDCDCKNYWMAKAARDSLFPFNVTIDFECHRIGGGGGGFMEKSLDLNCTNYNKPCTRRVLGAKDNPKGRLIRVAIDCHNNKGKLKLPSYSSKYSVVSLNISDNEITSLQDVSMPDSLQWIDLRGNNIGRLNETDIDRLFARKDRRVWFSQNQVVCDCDNKYLIDVLHEHSEQVEDFSDIICIDSDTPLSEVTSYDVCQINVRMQPGTLVLLAATIVTLSILILTYWQYQYQIKLFLYSRGWCLTCLRELDEDYDRPFDAFLSFAHGDDSFVLEHLLPKLEGNPNNYKIIVHFRDWVVGETIPAQIMNSITRSKRTIILLSKNFIESIWCSMEFKYAVADATKEKRRRLLVLVLDDVLTLPLDPEFKTYVEFNTYLSCDDPWFWEKLCYAMPHKKNGKTDQD